MPCHSPAWLLPERMRYSGVLRTNRISGYTSGAECFNCVQSTLACEVTHQRLRMLFVLLVTQHSNAQVTLLRHVTTYAVAFRGLCDRRITCRPISLNINGMLGLLLFRLFSKLALHFC